jgi:hypothetical protein
MNLPSKPDKRVVSLWLGLLREVLLEKGGEHARPEQFFVGYGEVNDPFGSRIGISWWRSTRYPRIERALATAILRQAHNATRLSLDDFVAGVRATLRDNALNRSLVSVLFAKADAPTLHAAYSTSPADHIVDILWTRLQRYVSAEVDHWLFVYPLERLTTEMGSFSCNEFCMLSSSDSESYASYCERFPKFQSLDIQSGTFGRDMILTRESTLSWLLIEGYGTGESVIEWGKKRASYFVGVLLSAVRLEAYHTAFIASSANPTGLVTVISSGNGAYSFKGADTDPILHSILGTMSVSKQAVDVASRWFSDSFIAPHNLRKRAEIAAMWVNQAAFQRNHLRFLFFFFAIDALFGVRFDVERNILMRVTAFMPGDWSHRCEWLFELRSELVHGGIASIREWKRYEKYLNHFQSEPEDDTEEIATTCLIRIFSTTH